MLLQAHSISFSYGERLLLAGADLSLPRGAKVALVGPNGSGKSTLLRILSGVLAPDSGRVSVPTGTLLLDQHIRHPELSGGEARLAALREAFAIGGGPLLLDEPTNDLDEDARSWLAAELVRSGASMVIVSHDPLLLDLVDEIWELKHGQIGRHPAGYEAYVARITSEEARLAAEVRALEAQARRADREARTKLESQEKRMQRGEKAGVKSGMPKIMRGAKRQQAESTHAMLKTGQDERRAERHDRAVELRAQLRSLSAFDWDSSVSRPPAGKRLLEVKAARLIGTQSSVSFSMFGPRRIHLRGKNGTGKSTLLRALAGEAGSRARVEGELFLAPPFHLFDQGLAQFGSGEPLWRWFQEKSQLELSLARALLGRLGFAQEEQQKPVRSLSGGERVRIELAMALHGKEPPQLLLLDEPTNHLDIESRRILQRFVDEFEGGILLVSHDGAFVDSLRIDETVEIKD